MPPMFRRNELFREGAGASDLAVMFASSDGDTSSGVTSTPPFDSPRSVFGVSPLVALAAPFAVVVASAAEEAGVALAAEPPAADRADVLLATFFATDIAAPIRVPPDSGWYDPSSPGRGGTDKKEPEHLI